MQPGPGRTGNTDFEILEGACGRRPGSASGNAIGDRGPVPGRPRTGARQEDGGRTAAGACGPEPAKKTADPACVRPPGPPTEAKRVGWLLLVFPERWRCKVDSEKRACRSRSTPVPCSSLATWVSQPRSVVITASSGPVFRLSSRSSWTASTSLPARDYTRGRRPGSR